MLLILDIIKINLHSSPLIIRILLTLVSLNDSYSKHILNFCKGSQSLKISAFLKLI